jgi:heat shock protein HslJ
MMGYQQPNTPMTVSPAQAQHIAQQWLTSNQAGTSTKAPDQFPGSYTLHILKSGKVTGMLSVNGYTGQVWYHTWHGAFMQMITLGA